MIEFESETNVTWSDDLEPELDEEPGNDFDLAETTGPVLVEPVHGAGEDADALLSDEELRSRHEARKPDITSWRPAIIDGEFQVRNGDYVVIERRCTALKGRPWLDTRVYQVTQVPDGNGNLELWDPIRKQCARSNWKTGMNNGFDFRLPPKGRNPETCLEGDGRRRTRRKIQGDKVVKPVVTNEQGEPVKRGRGRPKGSKNRDREIILAEKKARQDERRAKKERRKASKAR